VADTVWLAKGNRECTAAVTTPSPIAHSYGDVAAMHPSLCGHPKAAGSDPLEIEEDDQVETVVVLVRPLACDVIGVVSSFERFGARRFGLSGHAVRDAHRGAIQMSSVSGVASDVDRRASGSRRVPGTVACCAATADAAAAPGRGGFVADGVSPLGDGDGAIGGGRSR
jgi:hypothetical protein